MPMLGDLLAAARCSTGLVETLIAAADPSSAAKVREAAAGQGLSVAAFARIAVADFARFAGEEDWATLVSALRDDSDPGTACLLAMLHWRLTVRDCGGHAPAHSEEVPSVR